jgi:hypothetical protein
MLLWKNHLFWLIISSFRDPDPWSGSVQIFPDPTKRSGSGSPTLVYKKVHAFYKQKWSSKVVNPAPPPCFIRFFDFFRNWSVSFGSFGCFDSDSKHRNERNRELSFGFAKQTENQPKQMSFALFWFEPKKFFVCFVETRVDTKGTFSISRNTKLIRK